MNIDIHGPFSQMFRINDKSSAAAEMGDGLAAIDMGRKVGGAVSLDELRCWLDESRRQPHLPGIQTSRDSTAHDGFDAVSIIWRREAARGTGRVEQLR